MRTPELEKGIRDRRRERVPFERYNTCLNYRIHNMATTIIKTTNALNVPPTATGVTLYSRSKWPVFISKKKERRQ